jgi:hypothetical protein
MLELGALQACLGSTACLVTQTSTGIIIGMLLFLVASGVTLIFGVLHVVNFAHGAFYMIGAYTALSAYNATGSYYLAVLAGAVAAAVIGVLFERLAISRVYKENLLMQLLVCYAFVLIADDAVKIIWGAEYLAMGIPAEFRVPPYRFAGGVEGVHSHLGANRSGFAQNGDAPRQNGRHADLDRGALCAKNGRAGERCTEHTGARQEGTPGQSGPTGYGHSLLLVWKSPLHG